MQNSIAVMTNNYIVRASGTLTKWSTPPWSSSSSCPGRYLNIGGEVIRTTVSLSFNGDYTEGPSWGNFKLPFFVFPWSWTIEEDDRGNFWGTMHPPGLALHSLLILPTSTSDL